MGIAIVALLTGGHSSLPAAAPAAVSTPTSRPATEIALDNLLKQYDLRGKVVLVQVGLVQCDKSRAGLEQMAKLAKSKTLPELSFLRVEENGDAKQMDAYYKDKALPFPVYRDASAALAKAIQLTAYPAYLLVDKFGHIRYRGDYPESRLDAWTKMLVAEKNDPGIDAVLLGAPKLDIPKLLRHTVLPELTKANARPLDTYLGKAGLLIVFVDTTCPFSAEAMQDLPKVVPQLAKYDIPTVLINLDDSAQKVKEHYTTQPPFTALLYDVTAVTKNNWNIQSVPTVLFVTSARQSGYNGNALWKELATAVEKNLHLDPGTIQFSTKGTEFG